MIFLWSTVLLIIYFKQARFFKIKAKKGECYNRVMET